MPLPSPALASAAAACVLLAMAATSCRREEPRPPKPKKSSEIVADALQERQALNQVAALLRRLAAAPPSGPSPAARAAALLETLRGVPVDELPPGLRLPWQEMTAVLQDTAQSSSPDPSPDLRLRGEAAATRLNTALAAAGLVEFRF